MIFMQFIRVEYFCGTFYGQKRTRIITVQYYCKLKLDNGVPRVTDLRKCSKTCCHESSAHCPLLLSYVYFITIGFHHHFPKLS